MCMAYFNISKYHLFAEQRVLKRSKWPPSDSISKSIPDGTISIGQNLEPCIMVDLYGNEVKLMSWSILSRLRKGCQFLQEKIICFQ